MHLVQDHEKCLWQDPAPPLSINRYVKTYFELPGESESQSHGRGARIVSQDRNLRALRRAGCIVVEQHPKYSPDLNAIEGWWRVLRERLEQAAPEDQRTPEGGLKGRLGF